MAESRTLDYYPFCLSAVSSLAWNALFSWCQYSKFLFFPALLALTGQLPRTWMAELAHNSPSSSHFQRALLRPHEVPYSAYYVGKLMLFWEILFHCLCACIQCTCVGQKTTFGSLSLFPLWVPGIQLRLWSGLHTANAFSHQVILPTW